MYCKCFATAAQERGVCFFIDVSWAAMVLQMLIVSGRITGKVCSSEYIRNIVTVLVTCQTKVTKLWQKHVVKLLWQKRVKPRIQVRILCKNTR